MSPRPGPQTVTSRVAVWQLRHIGHPAVTSCLTLARSRCALVQPEVCTRRERRYHVKNAKHGPSCSVRYDQQAHGHK